MSPTHPETTPSSTTRLRIAAGVVTVIVIAAIVLAVINLTKRTPTPGPGHSTSEPATPTGDCPKMPATDHPEALLEAPATTWTLVGRMAAPSVEGAGPAITDHDGWRHCYARTPSGALVATANLIAMTGVPELVQRLAEDGIMPGDLRDQALNTPASAQASSSPMQVRGFRVVSFTPETAVTDLAIEMKGRLASVTVTVHWFGDDWRLGVRGDGATQELDIDYGNLPSLYGYVAWAGA